MGGNILIYLLILLILFVSYLVNIKYRSVEKYMYPILLVILWALLFFRYGQGTDYFAYNYILKNSASLSDIINNPNNVHSEIGFRMLCIFFNKNFTLFIMFVSTFEMVMLHRFIDRYSDNKLLSLLLFYPTIYMTYFFSALRQGIVIAIFIGFLFRYLEEEEWKKYYILTLVAISMHTVAVVLLFVPLIDKIKEEYFVKGMIVAVVMGLLMVTPPGVAILNMVPQMSYYAQPSISIFALGERVVCGACIGGLFWANYVKFKDNEVAKWIKIYFVGIGIYFLFIGFPLIASRFMIVFKVLEIIIFPRLFSECSKFRNGVLGIILGITLLMTVKNISSYISQGDYYDDVNVINYPYVSIFNKDNIWEYRDKNQYLPFL